jgi:hypothetical protein
MISIAGLDKAKVLAVLYNCAKSQGLGRLHYTPQNMTEDEARVLLEEQNDDGQGAYFDYLKGRVMKVHICGDELDPRLYDRDNGEGAAAAAISSIKTNE